jgi:hypothetical protein
MFFVLCFALAVASEEPWTHYCFAASSFVPPPNVSSGFSLSRVILMTRHGDRTPVNVLPDYLENVVWNCSLDMLVSFVDEYLPVPPQRQFRKK